MIKIKYRLKEIEGFTIESDVLESMGCTPEVIYNRFSKSSVFFVFAGKLIHVVDAMSKYSLLQFKDENSFVKWFNDVFQDIEKY